MMINDTPNEGVKLPEQFDFSNGSTNPYLVEARHQLIPPCFHCKQFRPILLDGTAYYRYFISGGRIADCFPHLTNEQRELLISGIHPDCWKVLFADEEKL